MISTRSGNPSPFTSSEGKTSPVVRAYFRLAEAQAWAVAIQIERIRPLNHRLRQAKLLHSWTISRYELQPDRIVFYLWSSAAEGDKFSFRFTPRYSIRGKAAPARLVDYYNPDLSAVIAPQYFVIGL